MESKTKQDRDRHFEELYQMEDDLGGALVGGSHTNQQKTDVKPKKKNNGYSP